eukprot:scaffold11579_cov40-Cyclotella_meneghiniana.AAC.6
MGFTLYVPLTPFCRSTKVSRLLVGQKDKGTNKHTRGIGFNFIVKAPIFFVVKGEVALVPPVLPDGWLREVPWGL